MYGLDRAAVPSSAHTTDKILHYESGLLLAPACFGSSVLPYLVLCKSVLVARNSQGSDLSAPCSGLQKQGLVLSSGSLLKR